MNNTQEVQNEYKVPEVGTVISGHKVLRMNRLTERVVGSTYASWIVLCEAGTGYSHKWVTWTVYATEEGFSAESGHYFSDGDWEKAVGSYDRRGGW